MRYNYSKEEKEKIKKILPDEKAMVEDYESYHDYFLSLTEQKILNQYTKKFNDGNYYEIIITQAVHMELLLKIAILLKTDAYSKEKLDEYSFYDIINIAFLTDTIPNYFAEHYHEFRNIRNSCAHDLFFNITKNYHDLIDILGKGSCYIFEIIDTIRKLKSNKK